MTHMTASEAMVETLRVEGVKQVFGIVGSAFMDALDLFPAAGIRFIPVRHEQSARPHGRRLRAGDRRPRRLHGAERPRHHEHRDGRSPPRTTPTRRSSIVTPSAMTSGRGLDGFQEVDQLPIFSTITKYQVQVPRPDRMAESFRTAFRIALAEHGPVQVDVPRDYLYEEVDCEILEPERYRVAARGAGDEAALDRAAELLAGAGEPGDHRRRRRGRQRRRRRGAPPRPAAERSGRDHLPAHRRVSVERRAGRGPDRLPGLQGGHGAALEGRRDPRRRLAPERLRHAAAVRLRLLPQGRDDHPDRPRPAAARQGQADRRRHHRRRQGGGRGARRPARAPGWATRRPTRRASRRSPRPSAPGPTSSTRGPRPTPRRSARAARSRSSPRRCPTTPS